MPIDEPVAAYFSNTGSVQYLTFSNQIINISNKNVTLNYMLTSENVPDFDITLTSKANNSFGEIVNKANITPMKITMPETIYAGVDFTVGLIPRGKTGRLEVISGNKEFDLLKHFRTTERVMTSQRTYLCWINISAILILRGYRLTA